MERSLSDPEAEHVCDAITTMLEDQRDFYRSSGFDDYADADIAQMVLKYRSLAAVAARFNHRALAERLNIFAGDVETGCKTCKQCGKRQNMCGHFNG